MRPSDHSAVPFNADLESVGELVGPFMLRLNSLNGYEVVGGDGKIAVWIFGEENSHRIVQLMNAAYEHGMFV